MVHRHDDDRFIELKVMIDGRAEWHSLPIWVNTHTRLVSTMPVLQIALDLMQLNRAVVIAHEAVDGGAAQAVQSDSGKRR